MKILEFGNTFASAATFNYISNKTLLEYDMVILDFNFILKNSTQIPATDFSKRRKNLEDFISYKNIPLVFYTPVPRTIYVNVNSYGQQRDFDFFAPIPKIETEIEEGNQMEIIGKNLFSEFMSKYKEHFHY